ncbi:MAG: fibronectin type III domain-containing protein [Chitinophagales bacterium]|nr:fibronectin type III domain-containing protein [Chitinophagales bacterium]
MKVQIKILLFSLLLSLTGSTSCNWFSNKCKCPAPKEVTISDTTATSARIKWTVTPNTETYRVQVSKVPVGGTPTVVIDTIIKGFEFVATGLTPATNYEAKVFSVCKCGNSPTAPTASFRTSADGIIVDDIIAQIFFINPPIESTREGNMPWSNSNQRQREYIQATASDGNIMVFMKDFPTNDASYWTLTAGTLFPTRSASGNIVTWAYNNHGPTVSVNFEVTATGVAVSPSSGIILRRYQQ